MDNNSNGAAVASLVLGIVGLVMASTAKKNNGGSGLATAGLVLSILAVVFGAVTLACTVCVGGAACAGAAL